MSITDSNVEDILTECAATMQRIANYRLPPALDNRMLWLSENKEKLSDIETEELLAAVQFAEERTIGKLQAQVVLRKLAKLSPDVLAS